MAPNTQAAEVTPAQWAQAITRIYGEQPWLDSSVTSEKPGVRHLRGWDDFDPKYQNRFLYTGSDMETAALLNELYGQDLLYFACQVMVTHERNWRQHHQEIIQMEWPELSPSGIPPTFDWKSWTKTGTMTRRRLWVPIHNTILNDPNFGPELLEAKTKGVRQTAMYTLLTSTANALAAQPLRAFIEERQRQNRRITYADFYARNMEFFCLGARSLDHLRMELSNNAARLPAKDTLIVAQDDAWQMEGKALDRRQFEYKVTQLTDETMELTRAFTKGQTMPLFQLEVGAGQPLTAITCPTFYRESDEPRNAGLQALRKQWTYANGYNFPRRRYGVMEELRPGSIAVPVLDVDSRGNSRWRKVELAEVIEQTGLFYKMTDGTTDKVFDLSGTADKELTVAMAVASKEFKDALVAMSKRYGQGNLQSIYQDMTATGPKDYDVPAGNALQDIRNARNAMDMVRWRAIPQGARVVRAEAIVGANKVTTGVYDLLPVQTIGQIPEAHHSTQEFINKARSVLAASRKGAEEPARILASILNTSVAAATKLLLPAGSLSYAAAVDPMRQLFNLLIFISRIGSDRAAGTSPGVAVADGNAQVPTSTVTFKSILSKLNNAAFDTLSPFATGFERLAATKPDVAQKISALLLERFERAPLDAGHIEAHAKVAAQVFAASNLEAFGDDDLRKLKSAVPKAADLTQRLIAADSAEWSKAKGATLAGIPMPTSATLAAPLVGENATNVYALDDAKVRLVLAQDYPVNPDRFAAINDLFPTLSHQELVLIGALFLLPYTPRVLARLSRLGLQFQNAGLVRMQTLEGNSMLLMKRGTETVDVLISPMENTINSRGVENYTDLFYTLSHGYKFNNLRGIMEFPLTFPRRVVQGWNARVCKNLDQVLEIIRADYMDDRNLQPACIAWDAPYSETDYDYPGNLFLRDEYVIEGGAGDENIVLRKNSGYLGLYYLLGPRVVDEQYNLLEGAHKEKKTPTHYGWRWSPIVERAATYDEDPVSRRWEKQLPGTGRLGPMYMNDHRNAGEIYNGGHRAFGLEGAPYADC